MLNFKNINIAKGKLSAYNPMVFDNISNSFRDFLNAIEIDSFRHINSLRVDFIHPVTVISGTNKIGKTSVLLLIAGSHNHFKKIDSTKPETILRDHQWKDVLSFTTYENVHNNYVYRLFWRVGPLARQGEGKRLANSRAWTGLAKYSKDLSRINAKIRDKEVRLIDLERISPARNFSNSLLRKIIASDSVRLNDDVEYAFAYVMGLEPLVQIHQIGSHINKIAYLITYPEGQSYSSYNAASGEESLLNILVDIFNAPINSLILIDELEAGFHPYVQRKLADVIQYVSWYQKKQFIITTHSPSLLGAFPQKSRVFIDRMRDGTYQSISSISINAAFSKMDSVAYPLVKLFCEDDVAKYIIQNMLIAVGAQFKNFIKLVNVIMSGPANEVLNDYLREKRNYSQSQFKLGYAAVFDGDKLGEPQFSTYYQNPQEFTFFLSPSIAPEKFLVDAYLRNNPHPELQAFRDFDDHHAIFHFMASSGLAPDGYHARQICWEAFTATVEYDYLLTEFRKFIVNTVKHFSELSD